MTKKAFFIQFFATFVMGIQYFNTGVEWVWPSYTLRYFEKYPASLGGTYLPHHGDLVGALPLLGCVIAAITGVPLSDIVGRKWVELIGGLICLLAWTLICTAKTINFVLAARFINGLGCGFSLTMHQIFISEYSEAKYRGRLITLPLFTYTFGILASYVMGWMCSYDVVNYIMLSMSVLFVVGMCLMKETPLYLLKKGRDKEALDSLKFYRGTKQSSQKILDELSNIKNLIETPRAMLNLAERHNDNIEDSEGEKLRPEVEDLSKPQHKRSCWKSLCTLKTSQRALITSSLLIILLVFTGTAPVQTFAGKMFQQAVPSLSADACSVALAVANMLGCAVPLVLSDYLGRRALMITSSMLVTLLLLAISALLHWPLAPAWAIPALMLAFCFCFQLGLGSVPFVFLAECFVPEVKTLCTTIAVCLSWIGNFIMLGSFRPMVNLIGMDGAFLTFAMIAAASTIISYLILPETAGLDTEDIQALLSKGYLQIRRRQSY